MNARTRHLVLDLEPGAQILSAHIIVIATMVQSSRQDRTKSAKVLLNVTEIRFRGLS